MTYKLAVDFGTTNSVVACWNAAAQSADVIALPTLSEPGHDGRPPLIPSLLYVHNGQTSHLSVGRQVRENRLEDRKDNRLFRNFKRGIVASPAPPPRDIDQTWWADADAGRHFLRRLLETIPYPLTEIDQLVLTTPVASFENYLVWLNRTLDDFSGDKIRVVDESTAAALGYTVTEPQAVVLVFDFGGGTLDLSLVQLPENRAKTGGLLHQLMKLTGKSGQHAARVIAKAGQVIGGSDIDQWLLADILRRCAISPADLGQDYTALLTRCEQTKIALSTALSVDLAFEVAGKSYAVTVTRAQLEALLSENGFFSALRRVVDKVMYTARQRGIFKEDINYVLMVGGTSLMPAVQDALKDYFTNMAVRAEKPFTAIAEGALQLAVGAGLEDYLAHSYGLRHLDPLTGRHRYDEIIPMGSAYPSPQPVEVTLGPAHADQTEIELVIGEIDTEAVSMIEVAYENGQTVFVAQADQNTRRIIPLNEAEALNALARLVPPGRPGEDRLKARFHVDENRRLRAWVIDLKTNLVVLDNVAIATLK